jgi:O-antigen ligase
MKPDISIIAALSGKADSGFPRENATDVESEPRPAAGSRISGIDPTLFWVFVAGLAFVPLWYGSNDMIAWGINALLFPGLTAAYEVSLLVGGAHHPVGIRQIAAPAGLFAAVVIWILVQNSTQLPVWFTHPIWGMAADGLDRQVVASISVNRDLTSLALLRLITAASVFWLALQLARDPVRAGRLIEAVAMIVCIYAAYGLVALALKPGRLPFLVAATSGDLVSSTFINHNSFATYAGIGLVGICGLMLRLYRRSAVAAGAPLRLRAASFIELAGRTGALLVGGAFIILAALLLTGSRGGILATGFGLFVLGLLTVAKRRGRAAKPLGIVAFAALLVAMTVLAFGDLFVDSILERGISDAGRMAVYAIAARSILDAPFSGYGYGTFADAFPLSRDRSIPVQGIWEQAHNTYLEVFQGVGVVFGSMLVGCVMLLVARCFIGAVRRRDNVTVPLVAASAACLVGVHAVVDFSLQIQAVALTFMAVLGAGVAQSQSSRLSLQD